MTLRLLRYGFAVTVVLVAWTTLAQAGVLQLAPVSEIGDSESLGVSKDAAVWVSEDGGEQECYSSSGVEISYVSNIESKATSTGVSDYSTVDSDASGPVDDASDDAPDVPTTIEIAMATGQLPGDANEDGYVDEKDLTILTSHWQHGVSGENNATWGMGDFNDDGKVDASDATILAANWGATTVPEPMTIALLLSGAVALIISRRLRRRS
jgi:hypothetical protein